jgi:hypothetical protein
MKADSQPNQNEILTTTLVLLNVTGTTPNSYPSMAPSFDGTR